MDCSNRTEASVTASELLLRAALLIPISHYLLGLLLLFLIILYNFLEFHLFEDLLVGFRGSRVSLTYNSCSELYEGVVSKCRILHGRYFATPWLSSPHFQTAFLNFFGRPPVFSYRRQLYSVADGGTIALDWLMCSDVSGGDFHISNSISKDDTTPIVVVVPGLTSDSASAYIKHVAFKMAKRGWNVVVTNHRGLGGISITSDCFYNAGWTEDLREVLDYLHREYSEAPLFAIGTSIGANVLVKYLGEDGDRTPIAGAVSICSPWDLLICDRFICRRLVQKLYDRVLTIGLQGYAKLHQNALTRLANWEGIEKSRSVRDFDNHATCLVGKFETVDTYYRRSSSSTFVGNVSVPLLCISALDDPVCTREAIPWDECRANKNIVLATTQHGGHLAFFEGIAANSLWWVRAVDEFFNVLHSSPFMHKRKKTQNLSPKFSQEPSIDQGPYLNVTEDGMVIALGKELTTNDMVEDLGNEDIVQEKNPELMVEKKKPNIDKQSDQNAEYLHDITAPVKSNINQLSRQNKRSMWLLAYIAIITTWPVVGSVLLSVFRKKLKNVITPAWLRR